MFTKTLPVALFFSGLIFFLPAAKASDHSLTIDGVRLSLKMTGWSSEVTADGSRLLLRGPSRSGAADVIALLSVTMYDTGRVPLAQEASNHQKSLASHYGFKAPSITQVPRLEGCADDHRVGSHSARFLSVKNLSPTQPGSELLEAVVHADPQFVYASLYYKIGHRDDYEPVLVEALRSLKVEVVSQKKPTSSDWDSEPTSGGTITWVNGFDKALKEAQERRAPILVAIGSNREPICLRLVEDHYHDPRIVALSREMVCLVASVDNHGLDENEFCKVYGSLNCAEHRDVEIKCREKFIKKRIAIAPQHFIFSPEGHLLSRREYFLSKSDLGRMMRGAISALASQNRATAELARGGSVDFGARYAAATQDAERQLVLNSAFHFASLDTVKDLLDGISRKEGRDGVLRVMRYLGLADHPGKLEILLFYLASPNEFIRRQAANLLAQLADVRAVDGLLDAVKRKAENNRVKAKVLLALGICAPGSPKEKKAFSLLVRLSKSGPSDLRISAIIGLTHFPTETKGLDSALVKAYAANKGSFMVKNVAALALGRHKVSTFGAVKMMEMDTKKVTDRGAVADIDWAIRCIKGDVPDPELDFVDRVEKYMLDKG